jgi:hypothetical protein
MAKSPTPAQDEDGARVTLLVSCATLVDNPDCNPDKVGLVPEDGEIFYSDTVAFSDGESVFDVLKREMMNAQIHLEFVNTPIYNSAYIEGINNLYEFDGGPLSGWMYTVNGKFPNYGCSRYALAAGDVIELVYTCDLGADVGGAGVVQKDEYGRPLRPSPRRELRVLRVCGRVRVHLFAPGLSRDCIRRVAVVYVVPKRQKGRKINRGSRADDGHGRADQSSV